MIKGLKIKHSLNKDISFLRNQLGNKKISEIKEIVNTNKEIQERILSIFDKLNITPDFPFSFLEDLEIEKAMETLNIKVNDERKSFILKINNIVKLNKKILENGNKFNFNLLKKTDLDYIYDILTHNEIVISERQLKNIFQGILENANNNIQSKYIIEVIDMIVEHKSFSDDLFRFFLEQKIADQNLSNNYIKVFIIFSYFKDEKNKELNNFLKQDSRKMIFLEHFLISPLFNEIKPDLLELLDLENLYALKDILNKDIYGKEHYIKGEINKKISAKENFENLLKELKKQKEEREKKQKEKELYGFEI